MREMYHNIKQQGYGNTRRTSIGNQAYSYIATLKKEAEYRGLSFCKYMRTERLDINIKNQINMNKEIKNAVMDIVMANIDHANYGMLSNVRASNRSYNILWENNIKVTDSMGSEDKILKGDVVIGNIEYRYAMRKRDGMYKMLKPKITYIQ